MYRFILKRLIMLIPVLLGVSFIVYTIMSFTPGDPVQMMLGDNYSEEAYAALEEELGHIIYTSPLTQYNGALGAALFAYQKYQKEQKA